MPPFVRITRYLRNLTFGRLILWYYFLWYLVVLVRYFDPNPALWLTAIGLSAIIGTALLINTTRSVTRRVKLETWPAARLYLFPFCVSSFSSLVKGRGFFLVFSPHPEELGFAAGLCVALTVAVLVLKHT